MNLRGVPGAGIVVGLSLLALLPGPAPADEKPAAAVESSAPATIVLSVRTAFPAGSLFVQHRAGNTRRYLGARAFTGNAPGDPVEISVQAPSGDGEIVAYLNSPGMIPIDSVESPTDAPQTYSLSRPYIRGSGSGDVKVSAVPGSTVRLHAAERLVPEKKYYLVDFCPEECGPLTKPVSREGTQARYSRDPAVPVIVTVTTKMTNGAYFARWHGNGAATVLAGRTFIDQRPDEPVELRLVVPAGPGKLSVFATGADGREARMDVVPIDLATVDHPRIRAADIREGRLLRIEDSPWTTR